MVIEMIYIKFIKKIKNYNEFKVLFLKNNQSILLIILQ
jgi:hypothetical protein